MEAMRLLSCRIMWDSKSERLFSSHHNLRGCSVGGRSHLPLEQGVGGKGEAVGADPDATVKAGVLPKSCHTFVTSASSPGCSPAAGTVLW